VFPEDVVQSLNTHMCRLNEKENATLWVCTREIKQEENKVEVMERQPLGSMMNGNRNVQSCDQ